MGIFMLALSVVHLSIPFGIYLGSTTTLISEVGDTFNPFWDLSLQFVLLSVLILILSIPFGIYQLEYLEDKFVIYIILSIPFGIYHIWSSKIR